MADLIALEAELLQAVTSYTRQWTAFEAEVRGTGEPVDSAELIAAAEHLADVRVRLGAAYGAPVSTGSAAASAPVVREYVDREVIREVEVPVERIVYVPEAATPEAEIDWGQVNSSLGLPGDEPAESVSEPDVVPGDEPVEAPVAVADTGEPA